MFSDYDPDSAPRTIVRHTDGPHGELVLRAVGDHFEIISNGTFLMDTRNGESERVLITAALDSLSGPADILIGGLGVGFSLMAALDSPKARQVTVLERLAPIINWHHDHLKDVSGGAVDDPRTEIVCADLIEWLTDTDRHFDAICLDIDNGPDWTVVPENARLYDDAGIALLASRLSPDGVVSIWSASDSTEFTQRLRRRFRDVSTIDIAVPHGKPDVVFLCAKPYS